MKTSTKTLSIVAAIAAGLLAESAQAVPTLTLSDGGLNTVMITDGGAGDANPAAGAVTFIGSVGIFNLNVTTGLSKPAIGSASNPQMDLSSIDTSTGAGTLLITFSDSGFTASPGNLIADFGGTQTNGSITNTVLQNGMLVTAIGPFTGHSFSGSNSALLNAGAPYSLTESVALNFRGAGTKSFDASIGVSGVPDGGMTITLLGLAVSGLAAGKLRRKVTA